jgi:serine/threonine protein kinase
MPDEGAAEANMEIELLSELDSPFIVGYLDSFVIDTEINIVMEYCAHSDLCSLIKR